MIDIRDELQIERRETAPQVVSRYAEAVRSYLRMRAEFLLKRYRAHPRFPGLHTGYDSITGKEFPDTEIASFSWINGRGAGVLCRMARLFPDLGDSLTDYAHHVIQAMERHLEMNARRFPFMADLDGRELPVGSPVPEGYRTYSDLYACFGFLEYGLHAEDISRLDTAKRLLADCIAAVRENRFAPLPDPTPTDRIMENPASICVDLLNEFAAQLDEACYLDEAEDLVGHLLERHYRDDIGGFVEYVRPDGAPFADEQGRIPVDPGHAIEFCSFALEFARLCDAADAHSDVCGRIGRICPPLILWNIERGWNPRLGGLYKLVDGRSGKPIDNTMPWWSPPETLLALLRAYERTPDVHFLECYREINNAYARNYLNPRTGFGPYQCRDGTAGAPAPVVPACKFQDPEFHSGRNLLRCVEILERLLP